MAASHNCAPLDGKTRISAKVSKESINTFFLAFFVFDLLLLPKFLFSTPLSFFLMVPLVFWSGRFVARLVLAYTGMMAILLASLIFGVERSGDLHVDNVKRMVQLCLVMGLPFFGYHKVNYVQLMTSIKKILTLFFLFSGGFAVLMIINSDAYESIIVAIYPESKTMITTNISTLRYALHFTDPNSFGYLVVFCFVLACYASFSLKVKVLIFCTSFLLIMATQSRGALFALMIVALIYWIVFMEGKQKLFSVLFVVVISSLVLAVFFELFIFYWELYEARNDIEESLGKGVGGGRLDAWSYFFQNFNINPFFGVGYYLDKEGVAFRPHSDFIRLQLSYGTLIFLFIFSFFYGFGKKHAMLLVAFFVPFMINTIIDDYRLFGIFIVSFFLVKWGLRGSGVRAYIK